MSIHADPELPRPPGPVIDSSMTSDEGMRQPQARRPASLTALRALGRARFRLAIVTIIAVAMVFAAAPLSLPGARAASPRVAIIVGPVGSLTSAYRADADAAAAEARRFTDDVVTVYSPNATWSAAQAAMRGASIVVYLGHGNGFPSRYSRTLNPRSQDGLGLNPVAGKDNIAHQYFGEAYIARVRLAPNAVVIFSHLCYASGNTEPGLAEGTLDQARRRVDNFAAGFLDAGAAAVIADGHMGPAYYVRSILAGSGTVEGIWRHAPNFHDHVIAFASERTADMTALLDPTRAHSQFYRSLVGRAKLRADEVARGAALRKDPPNQAAESTAPRIGPTVTSAAMRGVPVAGSHVELSLAIPDPGTEPMASLEVGVQWTPLDVQPAGAPDPEAAPTATPGAPAASGSNGPQASPVPSAGPAPSKAPSRPKATASPRAPDRATATPPARATSRPKATATPAAPSRPKATASPGATGLLGDGPPERRSASATASPGASESAPATSPAEASPSAIPVALPDPASSLVTAEVPGAVVTLADVRAGKKDLRATLDVPATPGLYRVETTLHDGDGVAFDAATQERIPALLVRVTGALSASIVTLDSLVATTGSSVDLPVAVMNSGTVPWAEKQPLGDPVDVDGPATREPEATLVGQWLPLDPGTGSIDTGTIREGVDVAPGATQQVSLRLTAPDLPGAYLVVLDVMSPLHGSLTAAGDEPVVVRVTVTWPTEASPAPISLPAPIPLPAALPSPTAIPSPGPANGGSGPAADGGAN